MSLDVSSDGVRQIIYERFALGEVPSVGDLAQLLRAPIDGVRSAMRVLADGKALVLQPTGEILMAAQPFSAVPTAFVIRSDRNEWWGNCIWDALGIPAMLRMSATLRTACQCCGQALSADIENGRVLHGEGVVHFAVPARWWWRDVVFT